MKEYEIHSINDYEDFIGSEAIERIWKKAASLQDFHVANINATYYGGGVAGLLSSFILLMNSVGIKTGWRVIQGSPDFFSVTKKMHNALQGADINLTDQKKYVYESVIYENAVRNHLDHDLVIIHDPQPLPMIMHYTKRGPWIWRCHIDLTSPNQELWEYIKSFVERYDTVILTLKEYQQELNTPQLFFQPAIDPFNVTNKEMTEDEMQERLDHYDIPTDLPLIAQISRFDRWKDPEGVIAAYKKVREEVDCTLVLLGNIATDDPEGKDVYESLLECQEDRIIIMSRQDTALVNALQTKASVVVQKSKREGFGLTVTEAMWKGTPVVGGNVGGIKKQIQDGENGFLVDTVDETADRILKLLKDDKLRDEMGRKARETVKDRYLLSRYLENYLDLFNSFETSYTLRSQRIGSEITE
ncbi:MAG: glycosyltransferase [candidate division Zixibacteria bacterium]|nr:glycosyltransferase [candidate division Zixibacteria bacterium]NIR67605.1 glycosyltransferase [candidate division Zixibacteria bacterium]NIS16336.1 glycosyltransferase [candidate division Zixibacteria bacterium]NIS48866.1 glycosyltransferase [candidate division Zixibacteria bacterium]NIT52714.1 glycosyltransferase [candidate division Zixibacteria bacterium]